MFPCISLIILYWMLHFHHVNVELVAKYVFANIFTHITLLVKTLKNIVNVL